MTLRVQVAARRADQEVAAPLGGMTLAQLGADVIRIDPIGGAADRTRCPLTKSRPS